jgi:hypothetical protein
MLSLSMTPKNSTTVSTAACSLAVDGVGAGEGVGVSVADTLGVGVLGVGVESTSVDPEQPTSAMDRASPTDVTHAHLPLLSAMLCLLGFRCLHAPATQQTAHGTHLLS